MRINEIDDVLDRARVLLKMADLKIRVSHAGNRYVLTYSNETVIRRKQEYWKTLTYETPEALLDAVKGLVNKAILA